MQRPTRSTVALFTTNCKIKCDGLIANPRGAFICDERVGLCQEVIPICIQRNNHLERVGTVPCACPRWILQRSPEITPSECQLVLFKRRKRKGRRLFKRIK